MTPGLLLLGALGLLIAAALASLAGAASATGFVPADLSYLRSILTFTVFQASLSAVLSLSFGALLALALARRRFPGRRLVLAVLGAATALPAIVVVFAVTTVHGRAGVLNEALASAGLPRFSIYGLPGILLAHVFFNAAFSARVFLAALETVPGEHWRLAAALGLGPGAVFRLIDAPLLRREAPALAVLVFILCATSFAIPLALGGGPGAATLEVAIFEALRFDADFGRAAVLALAQVAGMAAVVALAAPLFDRTPEVAVAGRRIERPDRDAPRLRVLDAMVLGTAACLFLPILAAIAWSGRGLLGGLDAAILGSLMTSLLVAIPSAALALGAALVLARARVVADERGRRRLATFVSAAPLMVLAVPPLALAAGLYLLARRFGDPTDVALPVLVLVNAGMALPFAHRLVEPAMATAAARYGRLAASLGMGAVARMRYVEGPLVAAPAAAAFAYAAALSLGDLGVVTLFGSRALVTLPALLYERLGAYRIAAAESVAAVLTGLVLLMFLLAERAGRGRAGPA